MQPQQLGPEPVLPFWSGVVDRGLRLAAYGTVFGAVAGTVTLAAMLIVLLSLGALTNGPISSFRGWPPLAFVAAAVLVGPGSGALGGATLLGIIGMFGVCPPSGPLSPRRSLLGPLGMWIGGTIGLVAFGWLGVMAILMGAARLGDAIEWLVFFSLCQAGAIGTGTASVLCLTKLADIVPADRARSGLAVVGGLVGLASLGAYGGVLGKPGILAWLAASAFLAVAGDAGIKASSSRPVRALLNRPWAVYAGLIAVISTCLSTIILTQSGAVASWAEKVGPPPPSWLPESDQLAELERQVNFTDKSRTSWQQVAELRNQIQRILMEGDPEAGTRERALASLLKLPRIDDPPTAPDLPFDHETARKHQRDYAAWLNVPVEFVNSEGMAFVLVPPGTFLMGSPDDESGHNAGGHDETRHRVTLTRPFYLGKHEVTVEQFRRLVASTDYVTDGERRGGGNAHDAKAEWKHRPGTHWRNPGFAGLYEQIDSHPVVHVSHNDATAYCRWRQQRLPGDGLLKYALPTESQWEWACRAGSGSRYWWGPDEDTSGRVANVGDRSLKGMHPEWPRPVMAMDDGHAFVAPVGSYRPSGFGLHDMLGNVWEFCSTRYGPYPKEAVADPESGDPKRGFAVRGGGWSNVAADVRCASRNADPPDFCHSNLGFRVAILLGD